MWTAEKAGVDVHVSIGKLAVLPKQPSSIAIQMKLIGRFSEQSKTRVRMLRH